MAVPDAPRAPGRVRAARDILDLVQGVLHKWGQRGTRLDVLAAQRVPGEDSQDRLHLQVFAPFQEF